MLKYLILEQEGLLDTRQGRINRLVKDLKKEKDLYARIAILDSCGINLTEKELKKIKKEVGNID